LAFRVCAYCPRDCQIRHKASKGGTPAIIKVVLRKGVSPLRALALLLSGANVCTAFSACFCCCELWVIGPRWDCSTCARLPVTLPAFAPCGLSLPQLPASGFPTGWCSITSSTSRSAERGGLQTLQVVQCIVTVGLGPLLLCFGLVRSACAWATVAVCTSRAAALLST